MTPFTLDPALGYFQARGVNVMAFDDIYPEGHQSGISLIMHGNRIATNGDIRFEQTPGQWQPVPKQHDRKMDGDTITTNLSFPDKSRHMKGFNPMIYPDFEFDYTVTAKAVGQAVEITVDLSKPVPEAFLGKVCFNLELFPGALFGKPWIMDSKMDNTQQGIFPMQPNGPTLWQKANIHHTGDFVDPSETAPLAHMQNLATSGSPKGLDTPGKKQASPAETKPYEYNPIVADDLIAAPYATGRKFTCRPDSDLDRFTVESHTGDISLYDGRMNHNNGWFTLSSPVAAGVTQNAIKWTITPHVVEDWLYTPVVQISQVGYHPNQPKFAIVETDKNDTLSTLKPGQLIKITEKGEVPVLSLEAKLWGQFLRYNYIKFDFTTITEPGLYKFVYAGAASSIFTIAADVYDRGVWQPVLEYFLPVQMCHMRVSEKYRVWHGLCHNDDARMAPVNYNHIDGYTQGPDTLTKYAPGEFVPGLNAGGWHDAGDFDLRVESQAGEFYILALAFEAFGVDYDATTIDQTRKIVEIHQPDGKNDILQQIEHGALSVVGAYKALGRLYRGIICNDLRQYVLLGDSAAMTDNTPGGENSRWVFTEDNPTRELTTAAQLAAAYRALKGFNDGLAEDCLTAAKELFERTTVAGEKQKAEGTVSEDTAAPTNDAKAKIHAAVELYLATSDALYKDYLLSNIDFIVANITDVAWYTARAEQKLADPTFSTAFKTALATVKENLEAQAAETPYGIPYRPHIWGAGWNIQRLGYEYYHLHKAYPEIFAPDMIYNALNFILGCHPGSYSVSFASGVGAKSATVGYGLNRADWSYIPGGVVSGTALIRPDFPELLEFPYLWQQVEYVMGGGSSHYMFLVLAAQQVLQGSQA